jgi:hypothetical protein
MIVGEGGEGWVVRSEETDFVLKSYLSSISDKLRKWENGNKV